MAMPTLLVKIGETPAWGRDLTPGSSFIGRAVANDLQLNYPTVSSRHCEIVVKADTVLIRDLGSTNGTFIDDQRITECFLRFGQILKVGSVEMHLAGPPVRIAIPSRPLPEAEPSQQPDASPDCVRHPGIRAEEHCGHCGRNFCEVCVTKLRRVGGAFLTLCPVCSGRCDPIVPFSVSAGD